LILSIVLYGLFGLGMLSLAQKLICGLGSSGSAAQITSDLVGDNCWSLAGRS